MDSCTAIQNSFITLRTQISGSSHIQLPTCCHYLAAAGELNGSSSKFYRRGVLFLLIDCRSPVCCISIDLGNAVRTQRQLAAIAGNPGHLARLADIWRSVITRKQTNRTIF